MPISKLFFSYPIKISLGLISTLLALSSHARDFDPEALVYQAGHPSLRVWLLDEKPPEPADNRLNAARVELGKQLFFDPRLSGKANISCASCHNPMLGWSDGLAKGIGNDGRPLSRATPSLINVAYNPFQLWDGAEHSLEAQALGPMRNPKEMAADVEQILAFVGRVEAYRQAFAKAYPNEGVNEKTLAKALASFERTIISNESPFDHWVMGVKNAMTEQQVEGFKLFVAADKGNCARCHAPPNFTDNSFHNIGLESFAEHNRDLGRYKQRPLGLMKGAFKTPTLRDIALSAPYFHDGSARDLIAVMEFYQEGGLIKDNLSPDIKPLNLSQAEQEAIIAFMQALSSRAKPFTLPQLPAALREASDD